jgi:hypothetical protein
VVRIEQDLTHCPLGSFQQSQIPANANSSPSLTSKQLRLFGFTFAHLLVKAVGRNHPLAGFHRIAESGLRGRRFRPCVDHAGRDGRVLRPRGNQPPAHQRHLTDGFLGILANHGHGLGRSNVVAWAPVFIPLRRSRSTPRQSAFSPLPNRRHDEMLAQNPWFRIWQAMASVADLRLQ